MVGIGVKISELAAAAGTQADTIRYYEREGLMPPPRRTAANYRSYEKDHLERLALIRHCRCLDMTLEEIRALLRFRDAPPDDCTAVNRVLDEHIDHVTSRIRELRALQRELRELRAQCASTTDGAQCGVLKGIQNAARTHDHAKATGDRQAHGPRAPAPRPSPGRDR